MYRRRSRSNRPLAPERQAQRTGAVDDLAGLPDAELARAWRPSHARLAEARNAVELERLYLPRRRQLDEIERRDPDGFRRWFGSGGWVCGDSAPS